MGKAEDDLMDKLEGKRPSQSRGAAKAQQAGGAIDAQATAEQTPLSSGDVSSVIVGALNTQMKGTGYPGGEPQTAAGGTAPKGVQNADAVWYRVGDDPRLHEIVMLTEGLFEAKKILAKNHLGDMFRIACLAIDVEIAMRQRDIAQVVTRVSAKRGLALETLELISVATEGAEVAVIYRPHVGQVGE